MNFLLDIRSSIRVKWMMTKTMTETSGIDMMMTTTTQRAVVGPFATRATSAMSDENEERGESDERTLPNLPT